MKSRDWAFLGIVGFAILALAGVAGYVALGGLDRTSGPAGVAENGSNSSSGTGTASGELDANQVIKVSTTGDGLPQEALNQISQLKNVSDARGYLTVTSGQTRILGADTSKPLVIEADGKLVEPSVVEGRLLEPGDAGQPLMVAGKTFAENNETDFGYPILGMAEMQAPVSINVNRLTVVGIYETGSAEVDNRIVLPLDTVQQLYGKAGQVNVAHVIVSDPASRSLVIDGVKRIVGKKAKIQELSG